MKYTYVNQAGKQVKTTDKVKANNEAYHADSKVIATDDNGILVEVFAPWKLDTSNLIENGFHNHELRNNCYSSN